MTRILLLGGSGFIGRRVARQLSKLGVHTRVVTRDRERAKADLLVLPDTDLLVADIHDAAQLGALVKGMDAVINLIGVLHDGKGGFVRNHVELPATLARLCEQHGVPRLLHMSALHASVTAPSKYLRSKAQGEAAMAAAKRVSTTIFRPSVVFGEGDQFLTRFAQLARWSPVFPLAGAGTRFQPVYVEDVAKAIAMSCVMPRTAGMAFELCGPRVYTLADLVRHAARHVGASPVVIGLPGPLAYLQALVFEHLPGRLLTRDNLASMQIDSLASDPLIPFPPVFGFAPTPLEAVTPGYLGPQRSHYDSFRAHQR